MSVERLRLPPYAPRTRLASSQALRPVAHVCLPPPRDHPTTDEQERLSISAQQPRRTAWSLVPSNQSRFEPVRRSGCDPAKSAFGSQILSRPAGGAMECNRRIVGDKSQSIYVDDPIPPRASLQESLRSSDRSVAFSRQIPHKFYHPLPPERWPRREFPSHLSRGTISA